MSALAPGQYSPEKHLMAFEDSPKYSFGLKTQLEKPSDTPAPGTYKMERSNTIILYDSSPSFTFGTRPDIDHSNTNPGKHFFVFFYPSSLRHADEVRGEGVQWEGRDWKHYFTL